MTFKLIHYTDYKSPYAYLALEDTLKLENDFRISIDWRPYTLNIPSYLGDVETRDAHQWRKVKYAYMDCRRIANKRGLTLKGPKKIYDSRDVDIALLYAKERNAVPAFSRVVFEQFFNHSIDVEDRGQIKQALLQAGIDASDFDAFADGPGGVAHDKIREEAESLGVFGVPAYLVEGELFWGGEKISEIRAILKEKGLER